MYANARKPYPMPEVEHFHTKPAHNGHFYVTRHFKANTQTGKATNHDAQTLVAALTELTTQGFKLDRVDVFENLAVLTVPDEKTKPLLLERLGRTGIGNYKHYLVEQPNFRDIGCSYIILTYTAWQPKGLFVNWMRGIAAPRIPWTLTA